MKIPDSQILPVSIELFRQGFIKQASILVDSALNRAPDHPILIFLSGLLFHHDNRDAEAADAFGRALAKLVRTQPTLQAYKTLLADEDGLDRLLNALDDVVESLGRIDKAQTFSLISDILEELGNNETSVKNREKALVIDPSRTQDKLHLALTLKKDWNLQLSVMKQIEKLLAEVIEANPDDPETLTLYANSLIYQDRHHEAEPILIKARNLDPGNMAAHGLLIAMFVESSRYQDIVKACDFALEHVPGNDYVLKVRSMASDSLKAGSKVNVSRWPKKAEDLADIRKAMKNYVFNFPADARFGFRMTDKIVTLGSCFAENIARSLRSHGIDAFNVTLGERLNSTFANLAYLERVAGGPLTPNVDGIAEILSRDPIDDRKKFEEAHMVIFTLGVAPNFFDTENGEYCLSSRNFSPLKNSAKAINGVIPR